MRIKVKQISDFATHMLEYTRLSGRSGGQQIIGGAEGAENLILESTASAEKGVVVIQPNGGGAIIGGPVGGTQGDGTINAEGVFVNGEDVRDNARRLAFFHG